MYVLQNWNLTPLSVVLAGGWIPPPPPEHPGIQYTGTNRVKGLDSEVAQLVSSSFSPTFANPHNIKSQILKKHVSYAKISVISYIGQGGGYREG